MLLARKVSSAAEEESIDSFSAAGFDTSSRGPVLNPGLVLLVSVLAISTAAPLIRFTDAPALVVSFWRLAISTGLIAGVLTIRGEWGAFASVSVAQWVTGSLAGVFLAGHFVAWVASLSLTTVAASVALVATQPVWVALFASVALHERPNRRQWLGIGVAVLGAAWIGWGDAGSGSESLRGDLLALLGAGLVAAYYVIGRGLRQRIDIWPYVGLVYGVATLTLLVAIAATGFSVIGRVGGKDWLVFALLAAGPMMIGHTGQNWALRYLPAYAVNLSLLGEPIGATLIAWLLPWIGEVPPSSALVGGCLILCGIALGMRRSTR